MFRNLKHLQRNLVLAMVGTDTYGARTMAGGQKDHKIPLEVGERQSVLYSGEKLTKTACGNLGARSQKKLLDLSDEAFTKSGGNANWLPIC